VAEVGFRDAVVAKRGIQAPRRSVRGVNSKDQAKSQQAWQYESSRFLHSFFTSPSFHFFDFFSCGIFSQFGTAFATAIIIETYSRKAVVTGK
jgi:hypothetical protein